MKKFHVMRHAELMEDEGRETYIRAFDTREEADEWIAAQKGEYFPPSSYYLLAPVETAQKEGSENIREHPAPTKKSPTPRHKRVL